MTIMVCSFGTEINLTNNCTGKQTEKDGCEFIKNKFMEMDHDGVSKIHTHYTCAISTENVKVVFGVVKKSLLNDTLGEAVLF